jgi:putative peptidoglycan lipid II flippase
MWSGALSMVVNVVAAFALFHFFAHVGIAAATSLAAWVNTAILYGVLRARGHMNTDAVLRRRLALLALASVLMGAVVYAAAWALNPWLLDDSLIVRAAVMVVLVAIGVIFFALFCHFTGVVDFRRVIRLSLPTRRKV